MNLKTCSRCGRTLAVTDFYKGNGRFGTSSYCKDCVRAYYDYSKREVLPDDVKRCPKCNRVLPLTSEYWRRGGSKKVWKSRCKDCLRKPERPAVAQPETRECLKCGKTYPNTATYFTLSRHGVPSSPCRMCIADKKREWRANNPEKVRQHKLQDQKRNKESARVRRHRWAINNPEKVRLITTRSYTKRRYDLPFDYTQTDWQQALEYWGYRCAICGCAEDDNLMIAKDHWIAVTDERPNNPGTVPSNIVPLCHTKRGGEWGCNNKKGNKDPVEWLLSEYSKDDAEIILSRIEDYFTQVRL